MRSGPRAAVILRSYNEAELIGRCLEAVFMQDFGDYEVILVDSASTDATVDIARGFPQLKIVSIAKRDFTYGRALNIGVESASASTEILAFLSAHAIPTSAAWLRSLAAPLLADPGVAACYGKQRPLPEHLSNRIVRHLARHGYRTCYGDTAFVTRTSDFFSNANGAIRRACWEKRRFHESIGYAEDREWAKRFVADGWGIAYAPDAAVLHSHAESAVQYLRRCRSEVRARLFIEAVYARPRSIRHYVSGLVRLTATFVGETLRRPAGVYDALDALLVNGVVHTATYLERRHQGTATLARGRVVARRDERVS